ncbi:RNA polymerase II subunit A C-terminal domain phosphatase SSU72 [Linum grandiflorum]
MESHALLKRHGFDVSSYGTGSQVKLPGPSIREPNVYDFGTPYKHMFEELRHLHNRDHVRLKTVLVINLEVKDNHEEAAVGARLTLDLCQAIEDGAEAWEESVDEIIPAFEAKNRRKLLYSISFY